MPEILDRAALDELRAAVGGDRTLFVELLSSFLDDAVLFLGELSAALEADDDAALMRPAHSLKSNAMNVGAASLVDLCRALEADARAGSVPDARERVAAIRTETDRVRSAIAELIDG